MAGTVAAAATAMTVGLTAPTAQADLVEVDVNIVNTHPLFDVAHTVGLDVNGILNRLTLAQLIDVVNSVSPNAVPAILDLLAEVRLHSQTVPTDAKALYDTLGNLPYTAALGVLPLARRTNTTAVVGFGLSNVAIINAYRALQAAAAGRPPAGYAPIPTDVAQTRINLLLAMIRNPARENGLLDRFPLLQRILGVGPQSLTAGATESGTGIFGGGIRLNGTVIDLNWAYDAVTDFPITANPVAILNSLMAMAPTNLLGGLPGDRLDAGLFGGGNLQATVQDLFTSLAGEGVVLGLMPLGGSPDGKHYYLTLNPRGLPLLEPLRLPARLLGLLGVQVPTLLADAVEPALRILVNIGYADVVTPADLADPASPYYRSSRFEAYDRAFTMTGAPAPFLSSAVLTPDEQVRVVGDVLTALGSGIQKSLGRAVAMIADVPRQVADAVRVAVQRVVDTVRTVVAPSPAAGPRPVAETAAMQTRAAEQPVAEPPVAENPVAENLVVTKPRVEKPAAERSAAERPAAERTGPEKPAAARPSVKQPVAEKSTASGVSAPTKGASARDKSAGVKPSGTKGAAA